MTKPLITDKRSLDAIAIAELIANGLATEHKLSDACAAYELAVMDIVFDTMDAQKE